MVLSEKQVEQIAHTARLELKEGEAEKFTHQLNAVLEKAQILRQLNTEGLAPTIQPLPLSNVLRRDEEGDSLPQELALANAPDHFRGCFRVPRIIE
ncbi:MAG: Asp-tRNA(Asn)/Glu-tRNA(Gln) amidotransferase subunit GatC [Firmicutes bacterium]|nr:Asp-tRNA(Asn)/Glu-tRNA(Gln) amidotransferase subunit GatC [Bacillota bacterium]